MCDFCQTRLPNLARPLDIARLVGPGENHDPYRRVRAADPTCRLDPIQHGHPTESPPQRIVEHAHDEHEHSRGLADRSILRSRAGIRAVSISLAVLTLTALAQAFIYVV